MNDNNRTIRPAGETEAGPAGTQPARDSRPGLRQPVESGTHRPQSPWVPSPLAAGWRSSPMPQKIHSSNTKDRPAVGRINCLAELDARPIQAEPVHLVIIMDNPQLPVDTSVLFAIASDPVEGRAERGPAIGAIGTHGTKADIPRLARMYADTPDGYFRSCLRGAVANLAEMYLPSVSIEAHDAAFEQWLETEGYSSPPGGTPSIDESHRESGVPLTTRPATKPATGPTRAVTTVTVSG